ncbi:hypothetical protein M3225_28000 [Priestia aryabhattai]|uniref:hypothetical protein n=1 Tax=Priestia aryabhattai TaxID=412384 RepID=UPI00203D40B1|nr:hypothetical protein [Priestia aryabhattai]MCM3774229.1 hypothetical protein [Priestia aryabhattai]
MKKLKDKQELTKFQKRLIAISAIVLGGLIAAFITIPMIIDIYREEAAQASIPIQTNKEIAPHKDNEEDKTPEVLQETKRLAEKFVTAYATLNPNKPEAYLKAIKPLTDERVYYYLSADDSHKPTATEHERKVLQLQTLPIDDNVPGRKKWQVVAYVEIKDELGNRKKEQMWYEVSVSNSPGSWKITGVEVK